MEIKWNGTETPQKWNGTGNIQDSNVPGASRLVYGEVREELHPIVVEDLVLDPSLRCAAVHLEGSDLKAGGAARKSERHLSIFLSHVRTMHAWRGEGEDERRKGRKKEGRGWMQRSECFIIFIDINLATPT